METKNRFIAINNKKISIGIKWTKIIKSSKIARERFAANEIKNSKYKYGILFDYKEDGTSLLGITSERNKNSAVGALLVSNKIPNQSLFFAKIEKEEDDEEDLYWLCVKDENGYIIEEMDLIANIETLAKEISNIQSVYDNVKIFSPKEDKIVFPDDDITELELSELLEDVNINEYAVKYLKKETNYPLLAVGITLFGFSAFIGYEYIYKENPIVDEIKSGILTESIEAKIDTVKKKISDSISKNNYSQEEYNNLANEQLNEIFDQQFFTKDDIVNNLYVMRELLPEYFVEWELNKVTYDQKSFIFVYKRLDGSSGSFVEINNKLNELLKLNNYKYQFIGNNDALNIVTYKILFESKLENDYLIKKATEERLKENKKDPTGYIFKEIENNKLNIENLKYSNENLSWINKRWGEEPNKIKEKIIEQTILINSSINKIEDILIKEKELKNKENLLIRKKQEKHDIYYMSYLNKSQLNPNYSFSTPVKLTSLPIMDEDNNKKSRKSKKNKKENTLKPLVDVYQFFIDSKEYSVGLDQAYEAMSIIDNKSIIYNTVDYNIKTNEWKIRGTMYETRN